MPGGGEIRVVTDECCEALGDLQSKTWVRRARH